MSIVAVVGNLARDRLDERPPRVGGAPFYAARALRLLGRPARIVTKCAEADRDALLPPLEALGIPVSWRASAATAAFSFRYEGNRRLMAIDALGDAWTAADARGWVAAGLGDAAWLHVAPLARSDFPPETLEALARGRRLLLDGQGLVRPARTGPLELDAAFDPALLRSVSVLKLAEEEAEVLGDVGTLDVPEVVVTLGSRGALVRAGGRCERIPAIHVPASVDPTGAGDAFAAVYVSGRAEGHAPAAAARRASALVARLLGDQGP